MFRKQITLIFFLSIFTLQFRVFTAAFLLSFLSVGPVKCSIDLKESVEELTAQIKHLAHKGCFSSDAFKLKRHFLRDRNTTCNDGTPAG